MEPGSNQQPRPHPSSEARARKENDHPPQSPTPIYWQHRRYESYASIGNNKPPPITLEDNTEDAPDIQSPLWAKHVSINSHVIVTGNLAGVGDYTVWNINIDTLDVSSIPFDLPILRSSSPPRSVLRMSTSDKTDLRTGRRDDS